MGMITNNTVVSKKDRVLSIVVRVLLGVSVGCVLAGAIASVVGTTPGINILIALHFNLIGIGLYILAVVVSELAGDLR